MSLRTQKSAPVDLLAHAAWLRRLALRLVRDAGVADDVLQDTWVAALRHPPDRTRPPRQWLAAVARNVVRMRARGAARQGARDEEGRSRLEAAVPTPDALLA